MIRLKMFNKYYKVINNYSISFSNKTVAFNDITIDFTDASINDLPYKYQKIELLEIDEKNEEKTIYTGYVDTYNLSKMKNKKEFRELKITMLSPQKMATIRTSTVIGTYTTQEAITLILQPLLNDGFVLKEANYNENARITLSNVLDTVDNLMNKVCKKKNLMWFINENREIFINSIEYLFGSNAKLKIDEYTEYSDIGLVDIKPQISSVEYTNAINIKNIRLICSSEECEIINPQTIKKNDSINFLNPIIIDEETLKARIKEDNLDDSQIQYAFYLKGEYIGIQNGQLVMSSNIGYDDEGSDKKIRLVHDSFFKNLVIGLKWGFDDYYAESITSLTALKYTTMKFYHSKQIEKCRGIVSDSGIIEKTVDFNEQWITLTDLTEYARSMINDNSNVVNKIVLELDQNANLKIGDIVEIDLPSYFSQGIFAVTQINYTYTSELLQIWDVTLERSEILDTYIDIFRPTDSQKPVTSVDNIILSEYIEENISEKIRLLVEEE